MIPTIRNITLSAAERIWDATHNPKVTEPVGLVVFLAITITITLIVYLS